MEVLEGREDKEADLVALVVPAAALQDRFSSHSSAASKSFLALRNLGDRLRSRMHQHGRRWDLVLADWFDLAPCSIRYPPCCMCFDILNRSHSFVTGGQHFTSPSSIAQRSP